MSGLGRVTLSLLIHEINNHLTRQAASEDGEPLLSVLSEGEANGLVGLEPLCRSRQLALHIALGAMDVVAENMKSCSIALCLDGHAILRWWGRRVTHAGRLRAPTKKPARRAAPAGF
ncbi:hypothetical protein ASC76_22570 [Rhizobacter sp. Root404]|jgi:hypothetical protein|nr:hypothetical protein ASC76_22570 [Rhizobacter sp. Root404]